MRAMAIDAFGGPERLRPCDLPRPKPAPEQVLIRAVAAGVNPIDWEIRRGGVSLPHAFPLIPGFDVAGVIEELGERSSRFRKGDRVWACKREPRLQHGCYAEYVAVDESAVAPMPGRLLYEEAAAVPTAALGAWQALFDDGSVTAGSRVLIRDGAGGVGHFAVQLAHQAGARVLATAAAEDRAFVHELGAEAVIDETQEELREAVARHFPEGVDLALETFDELAVRPRGDRLLQLKRLVEQGKLGPRVSKIYSLTEAPEAHRRGEEGGVRGKLVLNL